MAQTVKRLPPMQETWVRSLGWEDPLEKEMATHSSTLAWKIPGTEEPCRSQRVGHDWAASLHLNTYFLFSTCSISSVFCFLHYSSVTVFTVHFNVSADLPLVHLFRGWYRWGTVYTKLSEFTGVVILPFWVGSRTLASLHDSPVFIITLNIPSAYTEERIMV